MDTRNNIDAATGFGKFDLQLVRNGVLNVNIKVKMVVPGGMYFPNEGTYVRDWQRRINEMWSNKLTFRHPGLQRDIVARFNVQKVLAGEHFTVYIINGYDGGAGLKFAAPNSDPANVGTGNLYLALGPASNNTHTQQNAGVIGGVRQHALDNIRNPVVTATGVDFVDVTLDRNGNAWTVSAGSQATLNTFCADIMGTGVTGQPLYVHGASGLQDKANALVNCVINYIRTRGVTNQINPNAEKLSRKWKAPGTAHKATATVRVEIEDVATAYRRYFGNYVDTSHEFGHLIGLPDEYLDYSGFTNATIRDSQPNWDNLCTKWHLAQRNWHTQFNDSIMSIGTKVYPSHAATLIEALDAMTSQAPNALAANSWTLVSPT